MGLPHVQMPHVQMPHACGHQAHHQGGTEDILLEAMQYEVAGSFLHNPQ